jgi:flagellum-specific peptidoglycan hydrolase FlgJ
LLVFSDAWENVCMGTAASNEEFLRNTAAAALAAGHLFPDYAACEAALESGWGESELALKANNLFGQKQSTPPQLDTGTLSIPTREFIRDAWVTVPALWVKFPTLAACFADRMATLRRMAPAYPHYAAALAAQTGEEFITAVSASWSTDPQRAQKVLEIYKSHFGATKE